MFNTKIGALSSIPVDTPVEDGDLLASSISNNIKAKRVSLVEISKSTFS